MHLDILHSHCEEVQIAIPVDLSMQTIADGDMWNAANGTRLGSKVILTVLKPVAHADKATLNGLPPLAIP